MCLYSYVLYIQAYFIYLYVCMYSASSLWYIHVYIVFIRTLSFTFTSALLLTNSSAISMRPFLAAAIRAVAPSYIYMIYIQIYVQKRTIQDIGKEVSIQNTSYTIINIKCMGSLYRYNLCVYILMSILCIKAYIYIRINPYSPAKS